MLRGVLAKVTRFCRCALVFGISAGCEGRAKNTTPMLPSPTEAKSAADKLASLLPRAIGEFVARQPATTALYLPEVKIRAQRDYEYADRTLLVELKTGNVQSELGILADSAEHAFASDSNTYWRTSDIKGYRARIAEERDAKRGSTVYVRVSDNVVARLMLAPWAKVGESTELAAYLDFEAMKAAGVGVTMPAPKRELRSNPSREESR
jgi:hypothetical protein